MNHKHKTPTPRPLRAIIRDMARVPRLADEIAAQGDRALKPITRTLAARTHPRMVAFGNWVLTKFWRHFYVDVDVQGLDALASNLEGKPVVWLVTHRSHLDYLLISWILYNHGFRVPLIAAGENLNLPWVGRLLRMGGAFFIRRQFKGDRFYQRAVEAYVQVELGAGQHILIFPEGGRSRDGLVRSLKLGLIDQVRRAQGALAETIHLVPVSIAYDRTPDSRSYRNELEGASKKSEKLADLPKAVKALRADPLGRVRVSFSPSIPIHEQSTQDLADLTTQRWQQGMPASPLARIGLIMPGFTGHRALLSEINRALVLVERYAGLPSNPDWLNELLPLGYLEVSDEADPIVRVRIEARDELAYASAALRHRVLGLGLGSISVLSDMSKRRSRAIFDLAWPLLAQEVTCFESPAKAFERSVQLLTPEGLNRVSDNGTYRLLATLAEPVLPAVARIMALLKTLLECPLEARDWQTKRARSRCRRALVLAGRSDFDVLDIKPYERALQHWDDVGVLEKGQLTRRSRRTATRLLEGFERIDRQFSL